MGHDKKKRSHEQFAQDANFDTERTENIGIASTLAHIRNPEPYLGDGNIEELTSGEWTTVDRRSKKSKKTNGDHGIDSQIKTQKNLKKKDNRPTLTFAEFHKIQSSLRINDLQGLVLYCLADGTSPQWISVRHHAQVKRAVILFMPGLEKDMFNGRIKLGEPPSTGYVDRNSAVSSRPIEEAGAFRKETKQDAEAYRGDTRSPDEYLPVKLSAENLPVPLKPLADVFEHVWPVKAPGDDKYCKVHSPLHAMLNAPVPKSQEEKKAEKQIKGAKPVGEGKFWENKRTPITTFMASNEDLQENEFTLHLAYFATQAEKDRELVRREEAKETEDDGWIQTRVHNLEDGGVPDTDIEKGSLTAGRTVLAMDCEMCKVEGGDMALTRISIVGWDGTVVMDELVKPDKPIIDYLTPYSGITAKNLDPVTTRLSDIQSRLLDLLTPHTILLGHSLNSDLTALKITHPFIVDTSIIYQHPRGPPLKSSLKWLVQKYLNREIQKGHGTIGHDSVEDARACLDLVRMKCEKGARWGTAEAAGESIFKRLARTPKSGSATTSDGKLGVIVDHGIPARNFSTMASACIGCSNDDEVVEGIRRAVLGDPDGAVIPGGGVDFTWARLRELEALRGWSNENRHTPTNIDGGPETVDSAISGPSPIELSAAVSRAVQRILSVRTFLPPCTLLIVYSGTGDPRDIGRLQEMQRRFKKEYATKKWDELSVRWTDTEEQALKRACKKAREGMGLVTVT